MGIRTKTFLIVGSVLGCLFFAASFYLSHYLYDEFSKLERDDAYENISRLSDVFQEQINELSIKLVDWSQWDDMYEFVQNRNQDFIDANFPKETFMNLHINFAVVINNSGEIVYEKFVTKDGLESELPEGLEKYLNPENSFVGFKSFLEHKEGVLLFPDGRPVVVAARPITSSDGSAPVLGTAVFGYMLDEDSSQLLSTLTRSSAGFIPFIDGNYDKYFSDAKIHFSSKNDEIYVANPTDNENMIHACSRIKDVFGDPALILCSGTERSIFNKGLEIQRLFLELMVGVSVLFIVTVFLLLEFLVLRKISRLSKEVKKISKGREEHSLLNISGHDEFSQLGKDINDMLKALHVSDERKREYIKDIERMNSLMVERELRMVELKKEIAKLKGDVEDKTV